jgi:Ca2+-binding EF-hand superfamily protein
MDVAVFASVLSSSARRLESSLHTKLYAAIEANGGLSFLDGYAQAESRLLSYNAMQMLCDDLNTGVSSEELVLLFSTLDTSDSGHVPLDVLVYAMVAAWSATTQRIWLHVRKSALGQLKGEQAARVLTMGKSWVSYQDFASALGDNGIDMGDEDLLLMLVQLGSSIDGVVHAEGFAKVMDYEISLATHAVFSRIEGVLSQDGIALEEAMLRLDERGEGTIVHAQLVELLHTFSIGLTNEDLTMLLARLDRQNEGKINVKAFLEDAKRHSDSEVAWGKISDALGPSGGAQLAAFVGEGTALATPALLAALRQLGVDLTDGDFDAACRDLDPNSSRYAKVFFF